MDSVLVTAINNRLADLVEDDNAEDVAFAQWLIRSYLDRAPGMLEAVQQAVDSGDAAASADTAHALKGSSANVGLDSVAAVCAELEDAARTDQLGTVVGHPALIGKALNQATPHLLAAAERLGQ